MATKGALARRSVDESIKKTLNTNGNPEVKIMDRFIIQTVSKQAMVWDQTKQKRVGDIITLPDQNGRQRLENLARYLNTQADQTRL